MSGNINKLYKTSRKLNYQQQYKKINESEMVSTPVIFSNNIPISHSQYVTVKNPSEKKSLRKFLEALDVKYMLMSKIWVMPDQNTRKSYHTIICGRSFQSAVFIQK